MPNIFPSVALSDMVNAMGPKLGWTPGRYFMGRQILNDLPILSAHNGDRTYFDRYIKDKSSKLVNDEIRSRELLNRITSPVRNIGGIMI